MEGGPPGGTTSYVETPFRQLQSSNHFLVLWIELQTLEICSFCCLWVAQAELGCTQPSPPASPSRVQASALRGMNEGLLIVPAMKRAQGMQIMGNVIVWICCQMALQSFLGNGILLGLQSSVYCMPRRRVLLQSPKVAELLY